MIYEAAKKLLSYCPSDKLPKCSKNGCITLSAAATITYILWRLYKRSNKKSAYDSFLLPPLIEGGIPFFGNLLDLQENPGKFLDNAKNTVGPCFRLKIPGQGNLVVVTGSLIGEVMKSSKNFNFNLGIELLVPAAKVVKESYQHKFVVEEISPREKHPSKNCAIAYIS